MRIYDDCDFVRTHTRNSAQRLLERAPPIDPIHRSMLVRPFIANAGFYQDSFFASIDEDTVHIHANAILIVGWEMSRPQVARHHSEHCAAIETKLTIRNDFDAIVTKLHYK